MTQLTIIPKVADKTARFRGAVAAGEHVAVTIQGGADWLGEDDGANLTLRLIDETTHRTVAVFPRPAEVLEEGDEPDEWGSTQGGDLTCTLNLNTVQAVNAARHMLRVPVLFVLGDTDDPRTLYFKDRHVLEYWPERIGGDAPYDLGKWPKKIADWEIQLARMTVTAERVEGGVAVTAWDGKGERPSPVVVHDGERGATGAQGPQGERGPAGQNGRDGRDATVDPTLSVQGAAADAKATGDALNGKRNLDDMNIYAYPMAGHTPIEVTVWDSDELSTLYTLNWNGSVWSYTDGDIHINVTFDYSSQQYLLEGYVPDYGGTYHNLDHFFDLTSPLWSTDYNAPDFYKIEIKSVANHIATTALVQGYAVANDGGVAKAKALTQEQYEAISSPDANTLYVITED